MTVNLKGTVVVRSFFLKVADVSEEKRQKRRGESRVCPGEAPGTACSMFLILFQEKTELNKRKEILMFSVSVNAPP